MSSWYPESSTPFQEECQDNEGRGCEQLQNAPEISRKSTKIARRKNPTVDPRAREAFLGASEEQKPEDAMDPFTDAEESQIRPAPLCGFCRWQEKELLFNYTCALKQSDYSVHYREVSRRGGRQAKGCPRFQDLPDARSYIEAYRPFGYTSICTQSARTIPATCFSQDQSDAEEKNDLRSEEVGEAPKEKKQTSGLIEERVPGTTPAPGDRERRTRSYLHELATRLGVRESLRDYYFMTAILPSPPSITKNRQIDFILCATKNSNKNGSTTATNVDDSQEQGSSESKLSSSELPPIPVVPKFTRSSSGDNSNPPRFFEPSKDASSTPKKGEPSKETILLRTAQSLGLISRNWSSRKHDRPSEAGSEQASTYVRVSKGSAKYDQNDKTSSSDDVPPARTSRHNSSKSDATSPASGDPSSQEKRREDSAPPPNRKPHTGASQFTSAMRPQKLSRARRKLTAALCNASTEQDKPSPPQISGILGIHRHRLVPP